MVFGLFYGHCFNFTGYRTSGCKIIVNNELDKKWEEFLISSKVPPKTQDFIPVSDHTKANYNRPTKIVRII
jgi:hypothetical protein